jgi:hypothetical protein
MPTSDTTKSITKRYIFQVISIHNYKLYFGTVREKDTTHLYITCRYPEDLHKPRVKMRARIYTWTVGQGII